MGVQGNLWSEYLYLWREVDYMAYPRAAALAEVAWTPQAVRDFRTFTGRLADWRRIGRKAVPSGLPHGRARQT